MLEGWKVGSFPSELNDAGAKRGIRSLPVKSVSSRQSILAQPAEGQPRPSDDADDDDDPCNSAQWPNVNVGSPQQ